MYSTLLQHMRSQSRPEYNTVATKAGPNRSRQIASSRSTTIDLLDSISHLPAATGLRMSKPAYLYKIVPSSDPPASPLPEKLPLSPLDSSSGFIHLSTAVQIPGTLKLFFANASLVYILRIKYGSIEKNVKWETPDGTGKVSRNSISKYLRIELEYF